MDDNMTSATRTQDWQEIDARHHLAPFTDYAALRKNGARVITQADGHYITDSDGHRYWMRWLACGVLMSDMGGNSLLMPPASKWLFCPIITISLKPQTSRLPFCQSV